eukprot:COSAG01_NODE_1984_length_8725_cov_8.562022_4_plen_539_part_00
MVAWLILAGGPCWLAGCWLRAPQQRQGPALALLATPVMVFWLLLLAAAAAVVPRVAATVRTFGSPTVTSWPSARIVLGKPPAVIFNHTLSDDAEWGCMDQFWITADSDLAMAKMGVRLEVRYQFDGEPTPSVAFEPAMMAGNGWAAVPLAGRWMDGARDAGRQGIYAAGGKVGRGGRLTGWYSTVRMPFRRAVLVTAVLVPRPGAVPPANQTRAMPVVARPVAGRPNSPDPPYPPGPVPSPHCRDLPAPDNGRCINADIIVRGFEDTSSDDVSLTLPSGLTLPRTARMTLHHFEDKVDGFAFAELAKVPAGHEGVLFGVSAAIETSPPWGHMTQSGMHVSNSWIEGCWNMQRRASEPLPGLVLGTGFEDFIDSTYGFNILGPDPHDRTASTMQPALQRRCSPNGTAPFTSVNPLTPQHGVCLEGTLYQESTSGVVHYTTDLTPLAAVHPKLNRSSSSSSSSEYGVERVSVYRFTDSEIIAFEDGGSLMWRNSDPGPSPKCRCEEPAHKPKAGAPVMLRTYVWVYQWPADKHEKREVQA